MKFFLKPGYYVSYQGNTSYEVGPPVAGLGAPRVEVHHQLSHYGLTSRNYPEHFWSKELRQVGTVSWKYNPYELECCYREFPDPEVAAMFPGFIRSRYTPDWEVELEGEYPILVSTPSGFETLTDYQSAQAYAPQPIWWQGTALEMNRDLWYSMLYPQLSTGKQAAIRQHLEGLKGYTFGETLQPPAVWV